MLVCIKDYQELFNIDNVETMYTIDNELHIFFRSNRYEEYDFDENEYCEKAFRNIISAYSAGRRLIMINEKGEGYC